MSFKWFRSGAASINLATGNFNVQDVATITTPVAIPGTGVFTKLTCDGAGSLTTAANAPTGMTPLWIPASDHFDFAQLVAGDQVFIRASILVDILSVNTDIDLQLLAGIGEFPFALDWDQESYKTTGVFSISKTSFITMDTDTALDGKAEFQFKADKACNVEVQGWNYIIHRRL